MVFCYAYIKLSLTVELLAVDRELRLSPNHVYLRILSDYGISMNDDF